MGDLDEIKKFLGSPDGQMLAIAKNYFGIILFKHTYKLLILTLVIFRVYERNNFTLKYLMCHLIYSGRCALHIAVLKENEQIVQYLSSNFKQSVNIGDNVSNLLSINNK